ncbi:MaoC/PaaZ C-terminal domain-containing protein [Streptomyces sp. RFCAC02]|uniref:MaoC family dehydratase n=1 Tax=Streptomyces sp. RFCAC02 TaxID=2499143 RepID=UPI0023EA5523|nr:MaoC/PaaZ C-terminal domain-containing protein [Streptomyces sp. RFCAC02]
MPDRATDPAHLARYAEVCGLHADPADLPVTYPHVVAFPLAMELMTRRDFPFPVLGLVHTANHVERTRPIGTAERLTYRVTTTAPRPHPRGTVFDVTADATSGGAVVWRSTSTYLSRGGRAAPRTAGPGHSVPAPAPRRTETWTLPADTGRRYAAVSGDRNPIHLHALTARPFGFRHAIAHGMWTTARCLAALSTGGLPDAFGLDVTFRAPVPLPGRVRFTTDGTAFSVRPQEDGARPHLTGRLTPIG